LFLTCFGLFSVSFGLTENTETCCFDTEAKQTEQIFVSDNAENSFASRFGCFEHKLVSRDTLLALHAIRGFRMQKAQRLTDSLLLTHKAINTHFASCWRVLDSSMQLKILLADFFRFVIFGNK
jgi:hypothetical protein